MSDIIIEGGNRLDGSIQIQGSKNAVLPMMAASALHRGITVITNVPAIRDVESMIHIMEEIGCRCSLEKGVLKLDASGLSSYEIPPQHVKKLRSSVILLGALLGRMGRAKTTYPGGCSIGKRPIDYHLSGLKQLGAVIHDQDGEITAFAEKMQGCKVTLPFPSVGATQNIILASILAKGDTLIQGAAKEPEILTLCSFLNSMGAKIDTESGQYIKISGVSVLHDTVFPAPGDRIVAGTYLAALASAGGKILLSGVPVNQLDSVTKLFTQMGMKISSGKDFVKAEFFSRPAAVNVQTAVYPGFPTDMQSQLMAVCCIADGESIIREKIFDGRFAVAAELIKMGAKIRLDGSDAYISGQGRLCGINVAAPDLRGGAALVVAGLSAEGKTIITESTHILRGYENICRDLKGAGAAIYQE